MFIISDAKIEFLNNKILIICFLKVKAKATPRRITLWRWKKPEAPNTTEGLAPERMEEPHSYTTWFIFFLSKKTFYVFASCKPAKSSRRHFHELTGILSNIHFAPKIRKVQGTNQGFIIKDEPHSCSLEQKKKPQQSYRSSSQKIVCIC